MLVGRAGGAVMPNWLTTYRLESYETEKESPLHAPWRAARCPAHRHTQKWLRTPRRRRASIKPRASTTVPCFLGERCEPQISLKTPWLKKSATAQRERTGGRVEDDKGRERGWCSRGGNKHCARRGATVGTTI